jgi:hypothetical protein
MSKKTLRAFIAFLEVKDEISTRRALLVNQAGKTQGGEADIKLAPPISDEEMLAPLELGRVSRPS